MLLHQFIGSITTVRLADTDTVNTGTHTATSNSERSMQFRLKGSYCCMGEQRGGAADRDTSQQYRLARGALKPATARLPSSGVTDVQSSSSALT